MDSVENLLSKIAIKCKSATVEERIDLFVPEILTLRGAEVSKDFALAIILDDLLGRGYMPCGYVESEDGRIYSYTRSDD